MPPPATGNFKKVLAFLGIHARIVISLVLKPTESNKMHEILKKFVIELKNLAADKEEVREWLIVRAEHYFDEYFVKINLPGPDVLLDPILRATIRPLLGRLYDEFFSNLEVNDSGV